MSDLSWNRYGKSRIRLVKVRRPGWCRTATAMPHELVDLTIDVQLEGAFDAVYVDGDNAPCLATDTMKNTVYAHGAAAIRSTTSRAFALEARRAFRWRSRAVAARPHQRRRAAAGIACRPADSRTRTRSCRPAASSGPRS